MSNIKKLMMAAAGGEYNLWVSARRASDSTPVIVVLDENSGSIIEEIDANNIIYNFPLVYSPDLGYWYGFLYTSNAFGYLELETGTWNTITSYSGLSSYRATRMPNGNIVAGMRRTSGDFSFLSTVSDNFATQYTALSSSNDQGIYSVTCNSNDRFFMTTGNFVLSRSIFSGSALSEDEFFVGFSSQSNAGIGSLSIGPDGYVYHASERTNDSTQNVINLYNPSSSSWSSSAALVSTNTFTVDTSQAGRHALNGRKNIHFDDDRMAVPCRDRGGFIIYDTSTTTPSIVGTYTNSSLYGTNQPPRDLCSDGTNIWYWNYDSKRVDKITRSGTDDLTSVWSKQLSPTYDFIYSLSYKNEPCDWL